MSWARRVPMPGGGPDGWQQSGGCARCGIELPVQPYQGNPRKWCSESCRVAAWRDKRKVAA
jgi:hypothetical protein